MSTPLVLGTRDYCRKIGFSDVVIGLSGGIDSTIVAAIAADALGPDHVPGVSMPSRYSSDHSKSDAQSLAEALDIDYRPNLWGLSGHDDGENRFVESERIRGIR